MGTTSALQDEYHYNERVRKEQQRKGRQLLAAMVRHVGRLRDKADECRRLAKMFNGSDVREQFYRDAARHEEEATQVEKWAQEMRAWMGIENAHL